MTKYQYAILSRGYHRQQVLRKDQQSGLLFCGACDGGILKPEQRPYALTNKGCTIVIVNVPAMVCAQCGAVYYSRDTMEKLKMIVNGLNQAAECLAVVDFADTSSLALSKSTF